MSSSQPQVRSFFTPERRAILHIIRAMPGLPLNALCQRAGIGWGSVYHHVNRLARAGLAHVIADGRRRRVFPIQTPFPSAEIEERIIEVLHGARAESARRIARLVAQEPGISTARLMQRVQLPQSSMYYVVGRLIEAGLVRKRGRPESDLYPKELLHQALRFLHEHASESSFSNEFACASPGRTIPRAASLDANSSGCGE